MTLSATTLTATTPTLTASVRPQPGEYAPYYDRYISLVPANDVLAALEDQRREMLLLLCGRTEADGDLRYAPEKWSLKEVLGHMNDTERIMSYRALRISRGLWILRQRCRTRSQSSHVQRKRKQPARRSLIWRI